MHMMSKRIFSNQGKTIPHREIARINWIFKNIRRLWFKERFTTSKFRTSTSNVEKAKLKIIVWFEVDIILIIHSFHGVKIKIRSERLTVSGWDTYPWNNFCDPHCELICHNKENAGTPRISIPPEIAVGT